MLTERAVRERRWGSFPALRIALEEKPPLNRALTSIDDTETEAFARLTEIAALASHYRDDLVGAAQKVGLRQVHDDIEHLAGAISYFADELRTLAHQTRGLHEFLEQSFRRQEKPPEL